MSAQDKLNYYLSQVDKELSKYPLLVRLEQQTTVPKAYSVLAVGLIFVIFVFFNLFAGFLTNVLGWVIPAYFSLRALETPSTGDDVQWLTYWTVYGSLQIVETFSDMILYWFPFYYVFKTGLILWLVLPQTRGAATVYQAVLRPLVVSHKSTFTAPPTVTVTDKSATTTVGYES